MVADAENIDVIKDAAKQIINIIKTWITESMGDTQYQRALEALGVLREECIETEEPGLYNRFLKGLKAKLYADELGDNRKEMWYKIRTSRLGLIDKTLSLVSDVEEEEAKQFMLPTRLAAR